LDETVTRMCYTHRRIMAKLAMELIYEGKEKKAEEVLNYAEKMVPDYNVAHCYASGSVDLIRSWLAIGNKKKALDIIQKMWKNSMQYAKWYCSLDGFRFEGSRNDVLLHLYIMNQLVGLTETIDENLADKQLQQLNVLSSIYERKGGKVFED